MIRTYLSTLIITGAAFVFGPLAATADVPSSPIQPTGPARLPWVEEASKRTEADRLVREVRLREVLQSVESHLPLVEIARKQIEVAQGNEMSAAGAFDFRLQLQAGVLAQTYDQQTLDGQLARQLDGTPVELYGGWRRGQGDFRPYEGRSLTGSQGELRGGIKIPLLRDFLADPARTGRSVTQRLTEAEKQNARFKILNLKRVASDRYWEWVGAYLQLEAGLRLYRLAEERLSQVQRRAKAGSAAQIDIVEIERMIIQRKAQLIEAERIYQKSALELSLYYRDRAGRPQSAFLLPRGFDLYQSLPDESKLPPNSEAAFNNAMNLRGDLKSLEEQSTALSERLKLSKNALLPRLNAQLEYAADRGAPKDQERELRGLVTLSFPLENRESRGKLASAQAKLDQIEQSKTFLRDQVSQEVLNLQSALWAAHQKAKAMLVDRDLSEKLAQAERTRFRDGLSSLLIVNIREQTANDSIIKALDAIVEFQKLKILYQVAQGLDPGQGV